MSLATTGNFCMDLFGQSSYRNSCRVTSFNFQVKGTYLVYTMCRILAASTKGENNARRRRGGILQDRGSGAGAAMASDGTAHKMNGYG